MIKRSLSLLAERRDFRNLMGAQFCAQAGDGLVQAALAATIVFGGQKGFDLDNARSPDDILRIALYIFVPYTVISPLLGVLIDRWDRRRLLFVANGLRAVVIAIVALVGTGSIGDLTLLIAFVLTLSSTRVVLATKAAALPATLHESSLVEANGLSQLGGALFQLGGAGVALVAKQFIDAEPIALAGAMVYAAGAVFSLMIEAAGEARAHASLAQEVARVVRNIAAGLKEVRRVPKAAASITTYFWLRLLWSFSLVGIGFVARRLLADDDLMIAALTGGAGAIGATLGFFLAGRLNERVRSTAGLVVASSVMGGSAVAVLGGGLQLESVVAQACLALLTFFLGLSFFLAKISLDTMVQEALGDDFRGRAFSLYDIAYNLAWVLAAGLMKLLWAEDLKGLLISGMGVVFLVGIAAIALWFRRAGLLQAPSPVKAGS